MSRFYDRVENPEAHGLPPEGAKVLMVWPAWHPFGHKPQRAVVYRVEYIPGGWEGGRKPAACLRSGKRHPKSWPIRHFGADEWTRRGRLWVATVI